MWNNFMPSCTEPAIQLFYCNLQSFVFVDRWNTLIRLAFMGTWLLMDQVNREFNYFPFLRDKKMKININTNSKWTQIQLLERNTVFMTKYKLHFYSFIFHPPLWIKEVKSQQSGKFIGVKKAQNLPHEGSRFFSLITKLIHLSLTSFSI